MRLAIAILMILGAAVLLTRQTAVPPVSHDDAAGAPAQGTAAIRDRHTEIQTERGSQSDFEKLIRLDPGADRANGMVRLAGIWAKENPQFALESILAQTSGTERARGAAQALGTWAKADPLAAKAWLDKASLDPSITPLLRTRLYSAWAENDPRTAIAEAMRSGTGEEINAVFGVWGAQDLEGAVAFQDQLSPALQKETRATLLLIAAAQKSEWADALFEEFLLETSDSAELIRVGKALSGTHPELAALVLDHLSAGPETEAYRRKVSLLTADANIQEAGIPTASRRLIRAPDAEPVNSLPE
jgi:hypothetical protein